MYVYNILNSNLQLPLYSYTQNTMHKRMYFNIVKVYMLNVRLYDIKQTTQFSVAIRQPFIIYAIFI